MQLHILIKQAQQYNLQLVAGYYAGSNPQNLAFTPGTLPAPRQWAAFGQYVDVTNDVTGLDKLQLTWTAQIDDAGNIEPGNTFSTKSASGELLFYGDTFQLIKRWLIDDVSAPLNSVDVKVQHYENGVLCGTYEDYTIKPSDLNYCDTITLCQFSVTLHQKDEVKSCIKNTLIADNWDGWFQPTPTQGRKHPRFSYCNEQRPNGILTAVWFTLAVVSFIFGVILLLVLAVINLIVAVVNAVIVIINAIISFVNTLGAGLNTIPLLPFVPFNTVIVEVQNMFLESAGCGREHPAPIIRDYITNVCRKCGVTVNEQTAPIFFARNITIQTSDKSRGNGGIITVDNPHYNACYLFAPIQRGVRRFDTINPFGAKMNLSTWYLVENAPLLTLDMFLDELKQVYNAEWRLRSELVNGVYVPHLYFQRKDFYEDLQYIYDFSAQGVDRDKMVYGVCTEFLDKRYPAAAKGLYEHDSTDVCGNEALTQQNGYVTYGNTNNNPNYEGLQDKTAPYGGQRFRFDGSGNDYIFDAMQVCSNVGVLTLLIVDLLIDIVYPIFTLYADYALMLKHDLTAYPKILIWDGQSFENARAVKSKVAIGSPEPVPNIYYNNYPVTQDWKTKFPPHNFVIGSALTPNSSPPGYYTLQNFLGLQTIQRQVYLVNYPMYWVEGFYDGMWDWFHWIDDPNKKPGMLQSHTVKIRLCCDDLKALGLFGALNNVKLAQKVKVPSTFYPDTRITQIHVNYDVTDEYGMWIELTLKG